MQSAHRLGCIKTDRIAQSYAPSTSSQRMDRGDFYYHDHGPKRSKPELLDLEEEHNANEDAKNTHYAKDDKAT